MTLLASDAASVRQSAKVRLSGPDFAFAGTGTGSAKVRTSLTTLASPAASSSADSRRDLYRPPLWLARLRWFVSGAMSGGRKGGSPAIAIEDVPLSLADEQFLRASNQNTSGRARWASHDLPSGSAHDIRG